MIFGLNDNVAKLSIRHKTFDILKILPVMRFKISKRRVEF